ncbi:MAG TPA: CCE_0567 family metalloprotein [Sunxiuqinia sp.]|nr:CCE_0567 family metalloprotein [Sunxiuqinia sp.]
MDAHKLADLERLVNQLKFDATQKANHLHDLIEERLLTHFEEIPKVADATYKACKEWHEKHEELLKVKSA